MKEILFISALDIIQFSLGCLYLYHAFIFLKAIFFSTPYRILKNDYVYRILSGVADPAIWMMFFLIIGIAACYDVLDPLNHFGVLRYAYLLGAFVWIFVGVMIFLNSGFVLPVGICAYLLFHSGWVYVRLTKYTMLNK